MVVSRIHFHELPSQSLYVCVCAYKHICFRVFLKIYLYKFAFKWNSYIFAKNLADTVVSTVSCKMLASQSNHCKFCCWLKEITLCAFILQHLRMANLLSESEETNESTLSASELYMCALHIFNVCLVSTFNIPFHVFTQCLYLIFHYISISMFMHSHIHTSKANKLMFALYIIVVCVCKFCCRIKKFYFPRPAHVHFHFLLYLSRLYISVCRHLNLMVLKIICIEV